MIFVNALVCLFKLLPLLPLLNMTKGLLNITSLNINGLCCYRKQIKLIEFCKLNKIDVILIQEHNVRDKKTLCKEFLEYFHVSINLAIAHKGGTGIFINKRLPLEIISCENLANSRIMSMKAKIYDQVLHFLNIYAHSGSNLSKEREELFNKDILFILETI